MKLLHKLQDTWTYWVNCWNVRDSDLIGLDMEFIDLDEPLVIQMSGEMYKALTRQIIKLERLLEDPDSGFGEEEQSQFFHTLMYLYEQGKLDTNQILSLLHPEMYLTKEELKMIEIDVELEE